MCACVCVRVCVRVCACVCVDEVIVKMEMGEKDGSDTRMPKKRVDRDETD